MAQQRLPVFQKFIDDARAAWVREPDTEARMKAVTELLRALVANEGATHWPRLRVAVSRERSWRQRADDACEDAWGHPCADLILRVNGIDSDNCRKR